MKRWLSWHNVLRASGLSGLAFLVVFREHPDPAVLIILAGMMGLPTFVQLDQKKGGGE